MADTAVLDRYYRAWVRHDLNATLATLAPEVEYVNPPYAVEPGTRHGREAFWKALARFEEMVGLSTIEIEERAEAGDRVVIVARAKGRTRSGGVPVDTRIVHVWTLRDGLISRLEWFLDPAEGYAAAGIERPLGELRGGAQP